MDWRFVCCVGSFCKHALKPHLWADSDGGNGKMKMLLMLFSEYQEGLTHTGKWSCTHTLPLIASSYKRRLLINSLVRTQDVFGTILKDGQGNWPQKDSLTVNGIFEMLTLGVFHYLAIFLVSYLFSYFSTVVAMPCVESENRILRFRSWVEMNKMP